VFLELVGFRVCGARNSGCGGGGHIGGRGGDGGGGEWSPMPVARSWGRGQAGAAWRGEGRDALDFQVEETENLAQFGCARSAKISASRGFGEVAPFLIRGSHRQRSSVAMPVRFLSAIHRSLIWTDKLHATGVTAGQGAACQMVHHLVAKGEDKDCQGRHPTRPLAPRKNVQLSRIQRSPSLPPKHTGSNL
jgi:hypothetical protein